MGAATALVAAALLLIDLGFDLADRIPLPSIAADEPIEVFIETGAPTPASTPAPQVEESVAPTAPDTIVEPDLPQEILPQQADTAAAEPVDEPQPSIDWQRVGAAAAREAVQQRYRERDQRRELRTRSRSTMLPAIAENPLPAEAPVIAGFRFEPEFRVLGIGLTIGKCFFGIPLAGVPVEQRNAGPNVIVCHRANP